ncbi:hypothetical protein HHK36_023426 [Tetracentron sinense]|uniref:UDP-N-acetylglucosamine transferase subunit ALG14 n=1 Tax=Tetracentron sinense TaxID=13715 RepID=A0A834YQ66_TETSI|nr:hypothetical protein HHK36_023426 [Tetracentron sinense]
MYILMISNAGLPYEYFAINDYRWGLARAVVSSAMKKMAGAEEVTEAAQFMQIYRSREVGQSYLTSVATTLIAMVHALWLMIKIRPQVILCNGPGTCIPLCVVAFLFKVKKSMTCSSLDTLAIIRESWRTILNWEEEINWVQSSFKGSNLVNLVKKVAFNATIYHLWKERNNIIFNNEFSSTVEVSKKISSDTRNWFGLLKPSVEDSPANKDLMMNWNLPTDFFLLTDKSCSWVPPRPGVWALNTNDSLCGTVAGIGGLFRNHARGACCAFAESFSPSSLDLLEICAILCGYG